MSHPKTIFAMILAAGLSVAATSFAQTAGEKSDKLVAILNSDAPRKEKADALRELAVWGTKEAVPTLAGLLGNEELSHMARYALEPIPDPSVDQAFRAALGKLTGRPLVGVIGSIGVRKDEQAADVLGALLGNADPEVAQAAARALGKIGTVPAGKAIQGALANAPAANQLAFCEGLFRCAEALLAKGQNEAAISIYDNLRGYQPAAHQVRTGALRGAIVARGQQGLPLLKENLQNKEYLLFSAAVRTSHEMPGSEVTAALAAALPQLPDDNKIVVLQAIGKRQDVSALPAVFALARSAQKPVRLAAIRTIGEIANTSAAPGLLELMADSDGQVAQLAQETLAGLGGKEVDAIVVAMLDSNEPGKRITGIELVARRRMTSCTPALLKAAAGADANVRAASIRRLGELAGPADLPALLDLLMTSQTDVDALQQTVAAVSARSDDPQAITKKLISMLATAQTTQKIALLRTLSGIGGADALAAVRATIADAGADPNVRATAIRALGTWKTADAAPDLLQLAKNAEDPKDRLLGLSSYLRMAGRNDLPTGQRLAMCREAVALIQRDDEKKQLLSVLGSMNVPAALELITPHLENAATREEACHAVISLVEKLPRGRNQRSAPAVLAALQKVAQVAQSPELVRRAKELETRVRGSR